MAEPNSHPFLDHLVAVLAVYEQGSSSTSLPQYEGPTTSQTQSILRSLELIARRPTPAQPTQVESNAAGVDLVSTTEPDMGLSAEKELKSLKAQIQDAARVSGAIAGGDLSQRITSTARDPSIIQLENNINQIATQSAGLVQGVTRVLDGLDETCGFQEPKLEGDWRKTLDALNTWVGNLTKQIRSIATITKAVALGDLSKNIQVDARGEMLELKCVVNAAISFMRSFVTEFKKATTEIGVHGNVDYQLDVPDAQGVWLEMMHDFNSMNTKLSNKIFAITSVAGAIEQGDFSRRIEIQAEGKMLALGEKVNGVASILSILKPRITEMCLLVGNDGYLGQQVEPGIALQGEWSDLCSHFNGLVSNLTTQIRLLAAIAHAAAVGDFERGALSLPETHMKGETLCIGHWLKELVTKLSALHQDLTRLARKYGTEGVLGGQLIVAQPEESWEDLSRELNTMFKGWTDQIRSITGALRSCAAGDFSRTARLDVQGEMLELATAVNDVVSQLSTSTVTRENA